MEGPVLATSPVRGRTADADARRQLREVEGILEALGVGSGVEQVLQLRDDMRADLATDPSGPASVVGAPRRSGRDLRVGQPERVGEHGDAGDADDADGAVDYAGRPPEPPRTNLELRELVAFGQQRVGNVPMTLVPASQHPGALCRFCGVACSVSCVLPSGRDWRFATCPDGAARDRRVGGGYDQHEHGGEGDGSPTEEAAGR